MMYNCVIVDDEPLARELLQNHLKSIDYLNLVGSCKSAIEAKRIVANEKVDLLFIDVEMPLLKGTDFVQTSPELPSVIFTTAYRDFAVSAFELGALDYLVKPITFARFFKATEKFLSLKSDTKPIPLEPPKKCKDYIFIRHDRKQVKLSFEKILYIESKRDYVSIFLNEGDYKTKISLSALCELLDERFIRVHRSFVVNMDKVSAYTKQDIEIQEKELPIGEQYKEKVLAFFEK